VLVDLLSDPVNYTITLVDGQGNVFRQVTARKRSPIAPVNGNHALTLPYVSTSNTSLYYLDGDSTIKTMWLDGRTLPDITIPGITRGRDEMEFAVRPDGFMIDYSVLDYGVDPMRDTLFAQLPAVYRWKAIFTSTSDYVWPVAWHSGLLVLAHSVGGYAESIAALQGGWDNPYVAVSYHLVDPATAVRKVIMGACDVSGPLSPAGSACSEGGSIDWSGKVTIWGSTNWGSAAASLSADGSKIAAVSPGDQSQLSIWTPSSGGVGYAAPLGLLDWAGWIADEVVTGSYDDPTFVPQVVTVIGGSAHEIAAHGFFAALLPTNVV
jgi:hypothetical protein